MVAALVVTLAGLIPAAALLTASEPAEDLTQEIQEQQQETAEQGPVTETVVEAPPEITVDELAPEIVRVLQANGYAGLVDEAAIGADLPTSVLKVLIDNDAVLTVVEEPPPAEEGN
jgi:hypothetical protein